MRNVESVAGLSARLAQRGEEFRIAFWLGAATQLQGFWLQPWGSIKGFQLKTFRLALSFLRLTHSRLTYVSDLPGKFAALTKTPGSLITATVASSVEGGGSFIEHSVLPGEVWIAVCLFLSTLSVIVISVERERRRLKPRDYVLGTVLLLSWDPCTISACSARMPNGSIHPSVVTFIFIIC